MTVWLALLGLCVLVVFVLVYKMRDPTVSEGQRRKLHLTAIGFGVGSAVCGLGAIIANRM